MNLIKTLINDDNIIKQNYFISPFYDPKTITYIKISKSSIKWFNSNFKQTKSFKKIDKSLRYFYQNSKFNNYDIMIIGYLNKYNNFRSLCIFDLMLLSQFNGESLIKKYSIRYQNIIYRFLTNIPNNIKNVYSIFSKKYDNQIFNGMCTQCILSNKWEGYSLYLNNGFNEVQTLIPIKLWKILNGKIIKFEIDQKTNKLVSVLIEQNKTKNLYNVLYGIESLNESCLNKECTFKTCNINDKRNHIFLNLN